MPLYTYCCRTFSMRNSASLAVLFAIFCAVVVLVDSSTNSYDLPIFPSAVTSSGKAKHSQRADLSRVPKLLWVSIPDDYKTDLSFSTIVSDNRNIGWEVNLCNSSCQEVFINTTFAGTSLNWAFHTVSYSYTKVDLWKYAVLYYFGGIYVDSDVEISQPLDEIAKNVDTVLLSERKLRPFTTDCYLPSYHLSHDFTTGHYHSKLQKSEYYTGADKNNTDFFHGNVISTNIIVTVSRHLLFQQVLTNVVEIVKAEYLHKPIVSVGKYEHRQKLLVCSTNYVLTFTLRELLLLEKFQTKQKSSSSIVSSKSISNSEGFTCRMMPMIIVSEFEDLGMKKTVNLHIDHSNDLNLVPKLKQHFLNSYTLFTLDSFLEYLEGKTIMNNNNGREIFLVKNKKKHLFPDYETFLKLNYKDSLVKHIDSNIFLKIPDGAKLKSVMIDTKTSGKSGDKSSNDAIMKLSYVETERYLKNVSTVLNGKKIDCFGDDYAGTRDDYLNNVHKEVIGNVPIMVYPFCARTFQLGNTLGYYLNDLLCAEASGAHFITVNKQLNMIEADAYATNGSDRMVFFDSLPSLVINSATVLGDSTSAISPETVSDVKALMKSECDCLQYCWENARAPWVKRPESIAKYLLPSIDAYVKTANATQIGTKLNNNTDLCSLPIPGLASTEGSNKNDRTTADFFLPLIPNVTIQYRCGDNIGFGKTRYGLLPFSAYTPPRIDPKISKYIYVIADSPTRQAYHAYSGRCESILKRLFEHLKKTFADSVIVIKRGGDAFLDYARLAYSNIVVCSASTFCLWPALSNRVGQVHFPITPLVAGAWTNETAPNLTKNFHWIERPELIKQFKHYRPWWKLIEDLETLK